MERNIRLDVQMRPEITALNVEYEAIEGQEFSVRCSGRGKPAPEFKWINQDQKGKFKVKSHSKTITDTFPSRHVLG